MSTLCGMPYQEGDGEYMCVSWAEKRVRARKEHTCDECCGKIAAGQTYGRASAVVEGEGPQTWKRCPACLILAERTATLIGECAFWGGLDDFIESYRGDELPPDFPSPWEHRKSWEAA